MDLPPVDVIMPARNAAATIVAAIRSILDQTAPRLRVIVVDDGSHDATADLVTAVAQEDSRVHLLRRKGGGISAAMNAGLAVATAPLVARLDADDLAAPDRHARQIAHFQSDPATVACSGAHREIGATGRATGHVHRPPVEFRSDPFQIPAQEPPLTQPFFMARRAALQAVGGYRALPVSEDSDLYWRLEEIGQLVVLPEVLGCYRMHAGSISSASIRHGRRMALWSQLAALSAQRRRSGQPDLALSGSLWTPEPAGEADLAHLVAGASRRFGLSPGETVWLANASAAKLMELAGYRPFELQPADVAYLAERLCQGETRRNPLAAMRAATAARLLRAARLSDALHLGRGHIPEMMARAALGRLYWTKRRV